MSAIEQLAAMSQEQHARYHALYGSNPVRGDGLREVANYSRRIGAQVRELRARVIASQFSTEVVGPFSGATRSDPNIF